MQAVGLCCGFGFVFLILASKKVIVDNEVVVLLNLFGFE